MAVVWAYPYFGDVPVGASASAGANIESARSLLDEALATAKARWPDGRIDGAVMEGAPGPSLVQAASDATLLVVGARGAGGFSRLLLGSVSDHAVRHATCPVAVIRASILEGC